jgi:hypothetical protein
MTILSIKKIMLVGSRTEVCEPYDATIMAEKHSFFIENTFF